MEGRLLNLGTVDSCGRKFAKDCKIIFPNKLPVCWNFDRGDPRSVIGDANIFRDDKGLACMEEKENELFTDYNSSHHPLSLHLRSDQQDMQVR